MREVEKLRDERWWQATLGPLRGAAALAAGVAAGAAAAAGPSGLLGAVAPGPQARAAPRLRRIARRAVRAC